MHLTLWVLLFDLMSFAFANLRFAPLLKRSCLIGIALSLASPAIIVSHADEPKKIVLVRVVLRLTPEIDCPGCEDRLQQVLTTARGVQSAEIDVLTNRITICYDPSRVNLAALVGRIRIYGYTTTEVK